MSQEEKNAPPHRVELWLALVAIVGLVGMLVGEGAVDHVALALAAVPLGYGLVRFRAERQRERSRESP